MVLLNDGMDKKPNDLSSPLPNKKNLACEQPGMLRLSKAERNWISFISIQLKQRHEQKK